MEAGGELLGDDEGHSLARLSNDELWLILESGEAAIAALSMDGVSTRGKLAKCQKNIFQMALTSGGGTLEVRLKSPDWEEHVT